MQKITLHTRQKLAGIVALDEESGVPVFEFSNDAAHRPAPSYASGAPRMIRKIPDQNYSKLPKLVPINWL